MWVLLPWFDQGKIIMFLNEEQYDFEFLRSFNDEKIKVERCYASGGSSSRKVNVVNRRVFPSLVVRTLAQIVF